MNIECVICLESLQPTEAIHNTPCGHVFHYPCVSQWFQRSNSCPECRKKVPNKRLHRIFFNFVNENTIMEEITSILETENSNLRDQLTVKDKEIAKINTEKQELSEKNRQLQNEVDSWKGKMDLSKADFKEFLSIVETTREKLYNLEKNLKDAIEIYRVKMSWHTSISKDLISSKVQQSTEDSELKN